MIMRDPKFLRDSAAELRRWAHSTRDGQKAFRIRKVADRLEDEARTSETAAAPAESPAEAHHD
jgi:hypothetical protein